MSNKGGALALPYLEINHHKEITDLMKMSTGIEQNNGNALKFQTNLL